MTIFVLKYRDLQRDNRISVCIYEPPVASHYVVISGAAEVSLFGTPAQVVDRIAMLREDFSTDEIMFEVNWTASVPREVGMSTMWLL